jgi:hypothetical protein
MAVRLTIQLGPDVLKALGASKSITLALDSGGRREAARTTANRRRRRRAANREPKEGFGRFHPGSLGDRLVRWAERLGEPFGFPAMMKLLGVTRAHAHMILARARAHRLVKRVGHGAYAAASMSERALSAWREAVPFRPGSHADRLLRWASGRGRPFRTEEATRALGVTPALATKALMRTVAAGRLKRIRRGEYVVAHSTPTR